MNERRGTRVMFYVQHLLGIGHQMRAAAITRAMQRHGLDTVYVSGGFDDAALDLGGATIARLPPARAKDATFSVLLDENDRPVDTAWETRRRAALLNTFETVAPDVLLIEGFPFGRRRFRFELLPLLDAARGRAAVAVSVRDILVAKNDPARTRAIVDLVRDRVDAVIVHGDPTLAPFSASFPGAGAIADKIRYSGYVAPVCAAAPDVEPTGGVVVSVGGGAVGGPLLRVALAARPLSSLGDIPWRLVTGPNLPAEERRALTAPAGVTIDTFREDFRGILRNARLSISQAGYNTVMDLMITGTRGVLVPFNRHDETEQEQRAALLAERGIFQVLAEPRLTPENLAAAIDRAVAGAPPDNAGIDLNGAAKTAEIIAEFASSR